MCYAPLHTTRGGKKEGERERERQEEVARYVCVYMGASMCVRVQGITRYEMLQMSRRFVLMERGPAKEDRSK